jgi:hypothetical protein
VSARGPDTGPGCREPAAHKLILHLTVDRLALCRLAPNDEIPRWALSGGGFASVTRTPDELSLVCAESAVPQGIQCESGWRVFKIEGPLDFALTGILASVAQPLAEAGVSIFTISTYDTDYVMVKEQDLENALLALAAAGHRVKR